MIKSVFKKILPCHFFYKAFFCFTLMFISVFFTFFPKTRYTACAKTLSPSFYKTISTLVSGKHTTLSVKNLPKHSSVFFSSSDKKTASVGKNSGKLYAKKKGTVIISAQIFKKNGKKERTLKMKITILPKGYIENAHFSLKQTISPYNYTIRLKASRIILKKEIEKSRLSLTPEGKKAPKLSASFSGLSTDGKEVVYLLNSSSRKKLCPHDRSMDGTYIIRSDSFSRKIRADYEERLDTEDIAGFVLDINGTPLTNAFVSYQTTEDTVATNTDETGHYEVKEKGKPVSLTVKKKGYLTETLTSLTLSKKGTICENIILKSEKTSGFSLDFTVKTEDGAPVPNARVLLLPKDKVTTATVSSMIQDSFSQKDVLVSEETGTDGTLLLTNFGNQKSKPHPCTRILSSDPVSLSFLSSYISSSTKYAPLPDSFTKKGEYILYVCKDTGENSCKSYKTSFSPASFYTNHLHFEILLKKCDILDTSMLSLSLETSQTEDNPEIFSFSFFSPDEKRTIFEKSFSVSQEKISYIKSEPNVIKENAKLFSISHIPVSLSDGTYFLRLSGMDKNGKPLFYSSVTEIFIKDSRISPVVIRLFKKHYSRLFTYFTGDNPPGSEITFELYQKASEHYFYLDTFCTSGFTKNLPDLYTADLFLPCLLPSETYLFLPKEKAFQSSCLMTKISSENLHPTEQEALTSPPFAKYGCNYSKSNTVELPSDFLINRSHIFTDSDISITKNLIRTAPSCPNSVIVIYKKDGTLISTTLSPKLDKNTVFKKSTDTIIDIYTNHELLMTNQKSYR